MFIYPTANECEANNGDCEQVCMNTFLSFNCSCDDGYDLNTDGYTCLGKILYQLLKYKQQSPYDEGDLRHKAHHWNVQSASSSIYSY